VEIAGHVPAWTRRRPRCPVVGNLLGVQPGENLRLRGSWTQDRKYGEQFKADGYMTVKPATPVGIEKYLGSGMVRGRQGHRPSGRAPQLRSSAMQYSTSLKESKQKSAQVEASR
jgi:hypothetical protein